MPEEKKNLQPVQLQTIGCVIEDIAFDITEQERQKFRPMPDSKVNIEDLDLAPKYDPEKGELICPAGMYRRGGVFSEEARLSVGPPKISYGGAAMNALVRCIVQFETGPAIIRFSTGAGTTETEREDMRRLCDTLAGLGGVDISRALLRKDVKPATSYIIRYPGDRVIFTLRDAKLHAPKLDARLTQAIDGATFPDLLILSNCVDPHVAMEALRQAADNRSTDLLWISSAYDLKLLNEAMKMPATFKDKKAACMCLTHDELLTAKPEMRRMLFEAFGTIAVTDGDKGGRVFHWGPEGIPAWHTYTAAPLVRGARKVVDATGAGDSFSTTLAVSLHRGLSIEDAIDCARYVSADCVCYSGATGDLFAEATPGDGAVPLRTYDEMMGFVNTRRAEEKAALKQQ